MSLESATFIGDLDTSNPTAGDTKSQGDDHLRLIKSVLKNSFKNVTRAFYVPGTSASQTANFTIVAADDNKTFLVNTTSGTITATLPTLTTTDAGWECCFIKTNTGTNPLFIAPPSGTIQSGEVAGLAKTRRCIPGHKTRVYWTGSSFFAERVVRSPVGSIVTMGVAGLPVGYEWPNGQTLSGTAGSVYPDYYVANANSLVTLDHRGRASFGTDTMGTGPAGRVTNAVSGIVGATFGATGGLESFIIAKVNLPSYDLAPSLAVSGTITPHVGSGGADFCVAKASLASPGAGSNLSVRITDEVATATFSLTASGTLMTGGSGTALGYMPPAIMLNKVLVVE